MPRRYSRRWVKKQLGQEEKAARKAVVFYCGWTGRWDWEAWGWMDEQLRRVRKLPAEARARRQLIYRGWKAMR